MGTAEPGGVSNSRSAPPAESPLLVGPEDVPALRPGAQEEPGPGLNHTFRARLLVGDSGPVFQRLADPEWVPATQRMLRGLCCGLHGRYTGRGRSKNSLVLLPCLLFSVRAGDQSGGRGKRPRERGAPRVRK